MRQFIHVCPNCNSSVLGGNGNTLCHSCRFDLARKKLETNRKIKQRLAKLERILKE